MLTGKIEFKGRALSDVLAAIEAAKESIEKGNTTGFDHNASGSYSFVVNVEDEVEVAER